MREVGEIRWIFRLWEGSYRHLKVLPRQEDQWERRPTKTSYVVVSTLWSKEKWENPSDSDLWWDPGTAVRVWVVSQLMFSQREKSSVTSFIYHSLEKARVLKYHIRPYNGFTSRSHLPLTSDWWSTSSRDFSPTFWNPSIRTRTPAYDPRPPVRPDASSFPRNNHTIRKGVPRRSSTSVFIYLCFFWSSGKDTSL